MSERPTFDLLAARLEAATAGDVEAAKWLLREFCATVRQNRVGGALGASPHVRLIGNAPYNHTAFDERLLDYFAACFERIGEYEGSKDRPITADTALHLVGGPRGRKASPKTRQRQLGNGEAVHLRYMELTSKSDFPLPNREETGRIWDAIRDVAMKHSISPHTAARDYKEWVKVIDTFGQDPKEKSEKRGK
ncbi:hypothetical protein [Ralstonia thomasii]